jgi:cell division protein FtsZ
MPEPAKVFAFPAARQTAIETPAAEEPAVEAAPAITLTPPEGIAAEAETATAAESEEMMLDESMAETTEGPSDELLLGGEMTADDMAERPQPETRSWVTQEEPAPVAESKPEAPRSAGTLFERMSSIARGAQKANVPEAEAEETPRMRTGTRDPLDIPRFLNRQNNQ